MLFYVLLRIAFAFATYLFLAFLLAVASFLQPDSAANLARQFADIVSGQYGQSQVAAQPVSTLLGPALRTTFTVVLGATLLVAILGIPLGILAGRSRGRVADTVLLRLSLSVEALPASWMAMMLLLTLAIGLVLVPAGSLVIPALALAALVFPTVMRRTRQGVAELMTSGAADSGRTIIVGLSALLAGLIAGLGWTVAVEPILLTPGAARLLVNGVLSRDFPLSGGVLMTLGTAAIAIALLSDILRVAAGAGGHRLGFSHELAHYGEDLGAPRFISFGFIAGSIIVLALFSISLIGGDPNQIDLVARHSPVGSPGHPLGTDELGRDVLARLCAASRSALFVGLAGAALATLAGAILGTIGTLSSVTTSIVRVLVEVRFSLPLLLLAVGALTVFRPGIIALAAVIGLGLLDGPAAATLAGRYRLSGRALYRQPPPVSAGLSGLTGPWLASFLHTAASAILLVEAMNFTGLGLAPPAATFGGMMTAQAPFAFTRATPLVLTGLVLAVIVLALLLMADGVRSATARRRR
jgi:peptide/nickel transport system permease protein